MTLRPLYVLLVIVLPAASLQAQDYVTRNQLRNATQHFGILAGYWIPTGNLSILGNHPSLGLQWGFRNLMHEFDITLDIRFLHSRDYYYVQRNNLLYASSHYIGGYFGLDYKYYFFIMQRLECGALLGVGYDGFDLERGVIPDKPYQVGSVNVNTGFRMNIYTKGETYFSLQARYNFLHYNNKGGTSFSGNAISADFFVGGIWR